MAHSIRELDRAIAFHPQLLADFNTIVDLGMGMLAELDRVPAKMET